ncbi:hypothetical protein ABT099_29425 [Streptomyces prasinus]|uniref:hypothetical protein n=1 Tax=Streptomyces prasinus TaxID=67345 RepID=UPI003329C147
MTDGAHDDVEALREDIADVLQPLGLRLSEAKTQVVRMTDGFDFLYHDDEIVAVDAYQRHVGFLFR